MEANMYLNEICISGIKYLATEIGGNATGTVYSVKYDAVTDKPEHC